MYNDHREPPLYPSWRRSAWSVLVLLVMSTRRATGRETIGRQRDTRRSPKILFSDSLSGRAMAKWRVPPDRFIDRVGHGRLCVVGHASPEGAPPLPSVGDASWSRYRVELEFIPKAENGFAGLNFHVQESGDACGVGIALGGSGVCEVIEGMHIWGESATWKLHPESQGYARMYEQPDEFYANVRSFLRTRF